MKIKIFQLFFNLFPTNVRLISENKFVSPKKKNVNLMFSENSEIEIKLKNDSENSENP